MHLSSDTSPDTPDNTGRKNRPDGSLRVLIVDDSKADAVLFRQIARQIDTEDIELEHCSGFDDGLAALQTDNFDIAFIDYHLGPRSGTELISAAGGRECETPLVLLTGQFSLVVERQGIDAGAVDFVDKNILSPALLRRVIGSAQSNHGLARELVQNLESYQNLAASTARSNAEKSLFFAEMSHELRTPLNAIIGFSEILKGQMLGPIEGVAADRYAGYAEDIYKSSKHLLSLIDDLLDQSKFESGRFAPKMSRVSVYELVNDLLTIMSAQVEAAEISLVVEIADNLPDPVLDRRLVLQALLNVMSNAVKFTEKGGRIKVSARVVNDQLVLAVSDTGCGIPADELDSVLLPYRQGSAMETRPGGGTGLGLALTNGIVELHHGSVTIDSTVGVGTTIQLNLGLNLQ